MIRYLIILECVLLALLATQWVLEEPQERRMTNLPRTGVVAAEVAPPRTRTQPTAGAARASSAFSTEDRSTLARDLLGFSNERPPSAPDRDQSDADVDAVALYPSPFGDTPAAADQPDAEAAGEPDLALPAGQMAEPGSESRERPDATVAAAQRLLARLGYDPGPVDGVLGERTERAAREYRRRSGHGSGSVGDGEISEALLAQLRRDAGRQVAQAKLGQRRAARSSERSAPAANTRPGWVASVAGGFQRLLGQEFDSIKQPGRLRTYCRANQDTWIFDEGRRAFLYCGTVAVAR